MRRGTRRLLSAGAVGAALVLVAVGVAAAVGSITTPAANPFTVPADGAGVPQSFTIEATGFAAGKSVKVEICDGLPDSDPAWDVNQNCDLGTQTAGESSSGTGAVLTFTAGDTNFGIKPFRGQSPQGLFVCFAPS